MTYMNGRTKTYVNAGERPNLRVVAHLEYPLPHLKGDSRFNSITTACVSGRWVAGYDVTTNTFGIGVGVCAHFMQTFETERAAVYDAIRQIRAAVANEENEENRRFALRLCNLAENEIDPKLF